MADTYKWTTTDPDTKDFMAWLHKTIPGMVELDPSDLLAYNQWIQSHHEEESDQFEVCEFDDVDQDIQLLKSEIKGLERKLSLKNRQVRILIHQVQKQQRESVQLHRLVDLKNQKYESMFGTFKNAVKELGLVLDQCVSTLETQENVLLDYGFLQFDKSKFMDKINDYTLALHDLLSTAQNVHKQSTKGLSVEEEQEYARICRGLCFEKEREWELECSKVYYSSFLDQQLPESNETLDKNQNLEDLKQKVKEEMIESSENLEELKLKVTKEIQFNSEQYLHLLQTKMDIYITNQQISIQEEFILKLEPLMNLLNQVLNHVEENTRIYTLEQKQIMSLHYNTNQLVKEIESNHKRWSSSIINYKEYQKVKESKFINLEEIPVLQLFNSDDMDTRGIVPIDPLLSQCKNFVSHNHTSRLSLVENSKRVYSSIYQISQYLVRSVELLKSGSTTTSKEKELEKVVDEMTPIVQHLSSSCSF